MDRIPIEDSPDAVEEPTIQAKKAEDTEFAFRFPPGMEQQMGMLNSMLGAHGGGGGGGGGGAGNLFDQLLKGVQNPGKTASDPNNNPQHSGQPNKPQQSDMAGKMFEQSLGMIGSMLNKGGGGGGGGGADILGSLFGGGQSHKKQEPEPNKMYPKLDDFQEDKPAKPKADPSQLNIESFLNQGMDKLGLDDVFGNILGKPKKPEPSQQVYPNLDDLQGAKPNPNKSEQIDLEKIINQGIDVIGSALKGNAGNVLGQFLKSNVSTKPNNSSPRTDVPENRPEKSTYEPAAPSASAAAAVGPRAPEPEAPKPQKPQPSKEHHNNDKENKSKEESAEQDNIIDSIPEDAFIEAFDKLI